jgi:hypothetical protein
MKLTPWFLAAIAPIAIAGCSGTFLGHVAVLAVTFGIFFGTLNLHRGATALRSGASGPSTDRQASAERRAA